MKITFIALLLAGTFSVLTIGCTKKDVSSCENEVPIVSTYDVSLIKHNSAKCGGNVLNSGGLPILERGVCWSTASDPTIDDFFTVDGKGEGNYTSLMSNLSPNTQYFVRAYAKSTIGIGYGIETTFKTKESSLFWFSGTTTDFDGNIYTVIHIGLQKWMVENLKTTHYNDGTPIPNVTDNYAWAFLYEGGYCWYENNIENKEAYGALYNFYAVNTGKLCPQGWRVPNESDWELLTTKAGGEIFAGGRLKATGNIEQGTGLWSYPNEGATNITNFSAIPGGGRFNRGAFFYIGEHCYFWSHTIYSAATTYYRALDYRRENIAKDTYDYNKRYGFSVRCIKSGN
jgi:uncharacterized protein (TIGR02145 family)